MTRRKSMDDMDAQDTVSRRAHDEWKRTQKMLREVYGDDYYAKDYAQGVRDGTNRHVVDVLRDEVDRGWRDPSELERYLRDHPFTDAPQKEKVSSSRRCEALAKEWAASATGKELSREENSERMKLLMRAYVEDQQEAREKKYIDRSAA